MGKGTGQCAGRTALTLAGESGGESQSDTVLLTFDNKNGYRSIASYDPSSRKLTTVWTTNGKDDGKESKWTQDHEPWEGHSIGIQAVDTGQTGAVPFPPLWKKIDNAEAEKIQKDHDYIVNNTVKLDLPDDSPLAKYGFGTVILESEDPPTLAFGNDPKKVATINNNKIRYVKKGKYWHSDLGSYGKESGTSMDDMFGGSGNFLMGIQAFAPPGADTSTRLPKDEGLALRAIYHQLRG